jgi:hypothetical protein
MKKRRLNSSDTKSDTKSDTISNHNHSWNKQSDSNYWVCICGLYTVSEKPPVTKYIVLFPIKNSIFN